MVSSIGKKLVDCIGVYVTDRRLCFLSSNVPRTEGDQILHHLCNSLMISI